MHAFAILQVCREGLVFGIYVIQISIVSQSHYHLELNITATN